MKILVALFLFGMVQGSGAVTEDEGHLTDADKIYIVDSHNDERAAQGAADMYKIGWDTDLEAEAQNLANKCIWEHTADDIRTWGENMAMIMFPNEDFLNSFPNENKIDISVTKGMEGFKSWSGEKVYDVSGDFKCASASWQGPTCGHYTQVVWHSSTKVGCASHNCATMQQGSGTASNVWILVCAYMKPGNMAGEDAFITGEACSKCNEGDSCEGKLCVAA